MCVHVGLCVSHRVYGRVCMEACVCVQECVGVPWWVHVHKYEHESVGLMSGGDVCRCECQHVGVWCAGVRV